MKRKILSDGEVRWHGVETTRLSYDMIFREEEVNESNRRQLHQTGKGRLRQGHGSSGNALETGWLDEDGNPDAGGRLFTEDDVEALLAEKEREWRDKLERSCKEAWQLGLKEGRAQGREEATEELNRISRKLEEGVEQALVEWRERSRLLEPGLLDLVFEIAEKILKHPAEQPEDRRYLDSELGDLMQRLDETTNPVLYVSEEDFTHLEELKERVAPELPVVMRVCDTCKPGEYRLETDREAVVRDYQKLLEDFRLSLTLPSWREAEGS